jgi:TctA family transporter
MLDAALSALGTLLTPYHLGMLIFGVAVGLLIGILPGLGGIVGMSILLPFVPHLDEQAAFAMLIGMVAVIPTSDTFPSVLMGIPGSSGSQATILDGYPLAKRGEAARALGAAFSASLVGGLFGALVLTMILPIARPVVLAFASPELFMLALLGLSMVGVLSGRHVLKGLIAAGLGLMMGALGAAPAVTVYRYTFDIPYLTDGVPLVVVGLGLFALPDSTQMDRPPLQRHRGHSGLPPRARRDRGGLDQLRSCRPDHAGPGGIRQRRHSRRHSTRKLKQC